MPGILSMVQQVANALGVALIGNLFHDETGGSAAAWPVIRRRGRAGPGDRLRRDDQATFAMGSLTF